MSDFWYYLEDSNTAGPNNIAANLTDYALTDEANGWKTDDNDEAVKAQSEAPAGFVILTRPKHP